MRRPARCCSAFRGWVRAVDRIIASRRSGRLRLADVGRLTGGLRRAREFLIAEDWRPRRVDSERLAARLAPVPRQMSLF
jgi:predicted DNA-binding helix-hairpin-helix protein